MYGSSNALLVRQQAVGCRRSACSGTRLKWAGAGCSGKLVRKRQTAPIRFRPGENLNEVWYFFDEQGAYGY